MRRAVTAATAVTKVMAPTDTVLRSAGRWCGAMLFLLSTDAPALGQTPAVREEARQESEAFTVAPKGYVQFDLRTWPGWDVTPGSGRLRFETLELRRARPGLEGSWKRLTFEASVDPFDLDDVLVRDAYVELRLRRGRRVAVRVGQFKLPGSAEYERSAANVEFLERSALAQWIAPGRDIGAALTGRAGRRWSYEAGVFAGDANGRNSRSGVTTAGRIDWNGRHNVTFGTFGSVGRISAVETDPANGLEARSPAGYRFFDRVYVDGLRGRTGADVSWSPGPWVVRGEWLRATEQRRGQGLDLEDLPSLVSQGWSASMTRTFGRRTGAARERWREWEIGLRAEGVSFDDTDGATGRDSVRLRATDVRRRAEQSVTGSLSWSPTAWSRWLITSGLERFPEARSAPNAGSSGPYWVAGVRFQLELP